MYKYLFTPIKINQTWIKNRIVYPALGLLYSYDGKLNDRYYNFFKERAKGGAGIITVGPVGVDFIGSGIIVLSLANDEDIPSFKKLTDIIKNEGGKAWIQLFHAGAYSHPILINGQAPIAPSPVFSKYSKATPREMTIEDIKSVQQSYAKAAIRAIEAGFDGIEILASAGYLITQFLSPLKNQRTDEYGGIFENRIRFAKEVIEIVRKSVGKDYPLTVRMAGNDFVEGSNTDKETAIIAQTYEKLGADAINVTGGWHESRVPQLPMELPRSAYSYLALNIKRGVSIPVMASNRISTPDAAEKILKDGYADMVSLGRVLIADPYWPNKALEGKANEIRPCVACSQGCTDQVFNGLPIFCIANPRAGFEGERVIAKTDTPKKVMVIGAGASGLEAAVTAAIAGHKVEIYEKDGRIGGQLWMAGAPPHKQELLEIIRYYQTMLQKYSIPLYLNTNVDACMLKEKKPEFVIVSEGAEPLIPPIKGTDDSLILSSWKVLKENPLLGKNVAIIGGGSVGLETAMFVASKGTISPETLYFLFAYGAQSNERLRELMFKGSSSVTIFEMLPVAGKDVGKSTKWVLMDNLKRFNVNIVTGAKVSSVEKGIVKYEKEGKYEEAKFDNIIIAAGSRPVKNVSNLLKTLDIPFISIGDCVKIGKINDAIHGGFLAATKLGQ